MYTLYSKQNCPGCDKAKNLLALKGKKFKIVEIVHGLQAGDNQISIIEFTDKFPSVRQVPLIVNDETNEQYNLTQLLDLLK